MGAIFGPGTSFGKNLLINQQVILHTKFQAPEPSSSGEEDFLVYFIFEPNTPCRRTILDPRATILKKHLSMLHIKFQASVPSGREEESI